MREADPSKSERAGADPGSGGPPWILGHRGAPREAPENTLASLSRALELGLDGVEYDLHACATGEPILIHDETLDRTTDASGPVASLTLPQLAAIDAGAWFDKRFRSEPLPLLEEALEIDGDVAGARPMHMIELKDPTLVREVARQLREVSVPLSFRIASFERAVVLEARDLGLPTMLLTNEAREEDLGFVRDERIDAYSTAPGGWRNAAGRSEWPCERWAWSVDEPADLLEACRIPMNGFNTNEPRRALATRALVRLAPDDAGPFPVHVPPLEVPSAMLHGSGPARHGEWSGRWRSEVSLRNPFPFPVRATLELVVRGGAFEVSGLPFACDLPVAGERAVPLAIAGGSWSPREDPLVVATFEWSPGPVGGPGGRGPGGRADAAQGSLVLDAPVARIRRLHIGAGSLRLEMLREHPGEAAASMTLRRRGRELVASVEDAGGLVEPRAILRIDSVVRVGGRGVRMPLPADFDRRGEIGCEFAVGFEGRGTGAAAHKRLRRWCGGLPYGLTSGAPGRLHPGGRG